MNNLDYDENRLVINEADSSVNIICNKGCSADTKELMLYGITRQELIENIVTYGAPLSLLEVLVNTEYIFMCRNTVGVMEAAWNSEKFLEVPIFDLNDVFLNICLESENTKRLNLKLKSSIM